jgi:hypothetical protein
LCDTCVSRAEEICMHRENACKAVNRAEYYIDISSCANSGNKECVRLTTDAYDKSALACAVGAQACMLGATDGCSRCDFGSLQ